MIKKILFTELKLLRNDSRLRLLVVFTAILLAISVWISTTSHKERVQQHHFASDNAREQWENIGEYNPHSAAHFGTFVYKPSGILGMLENGVEPYTGNVLRVEGHVQNEAQFSTASLQGGMVRLGILQPGLMLHSIIPLLIIFLAYGAISRERESGLLKLLILQGVNIRSLIIGKSMAYWLLCLCFLLIVLMAYTLLAMTNPVHQGETDMVRLFAFAGIYTFFFAIVAFLTVLVSATSGSSRGALALLTVIWTLLVVLLPRLTMQTGENLYPFPTRSEFQKSMQDDRRQGLDGHNPSDQRKKALEAQVLGSYGVDSLSQLPINFDGLAMQADEEYGNQVWDKHFGYYFDTLQRQNYISQWMSLVNPFWAIRSLGMAIAGTDLYHYLNFLTQAENYRRDLIKALNHEHTYGGSLTGDWGWKANPEFFQSLADFEYLVPGLGWSLGYRIPEIISLLLWFAWLVFWIFKKTNTTGVLRP